MSRDPAPHHDAADREHGDTDRVLAGRVIKPHGIRGEVLVEVFSERAERFSSGARLHADTRTFVVRSARPHQGRLIVGFEDVSDRTAAERLRGLNLEADPLHSDEDSETYFVSELVGMRVLAGDGRDLGVVTAVVELPAAADYDLLEVVASEGPTWLLPAAAEYVKVEAGEHGSDRLILVSPPEGLVPAEFALPSDRDDREVAPPPGR